MMNSQLARRPWMRWVVPVAVAAVAVGGTALVSELSASAAELAPRSAAQLLVDVQSAAATAGSGTVVQKADLGLPELPGVGGAGSSSLTSLIAGNHTLRVWYDGGTKTRVALLGTLGESDVIRNGSDVWAWSSDTNTATHLVLPADEAKKTPADQAADARAELDLTPQEIAEKALAAIDPTTKVSTDGPVTVAGRDAYELVLEPRDASSTVGQVRIAVDGEKYVPLRVQVFGKGAEVAAVEVGFTQISFATPSASQFRFSPPPGVKVTEEKLDFPGDKPAAAAKSAAEKAIEDDDAPVVSGKGWTAVVQAQLPEGGLDGTDGDASVAELNGVLKALPEKSGSWGSGRLLHTSLFNVLLLDDGRVLTGAVAAERLYELAAKPLPTADGTAK